MRFLAFAMLMASAVTSALSQNLVLNPDLEDVNTLTCGYIGSKAQFDSQINNWTMPSNGTSDLQNTIVPTNCSNHHPNSTLGCTHGSQVPRSGDVMLGTWLYAPFAVTNYREYAQGSLSTPMTPGKAYVVEFYTSLGDQSRFAIDELGLYFSTTPVYFAQYANLPVTPQVVVNQLFDDMVGWTLVRDTFIPTQPYEYFVVGNFEDNATVSFFPADSNGCMGGTYAYFDDFRIEALDTTLTVQDTIVCKGTTVDIVAVGAPPLWWADATKPNDTIGTGNVLTVTPDSTTTYIVTNSYKSKQATVTVFEMKVDLGPDTVVCTTGGITLDARTPFSAYEWQDGDSLPFYEVRQPGTYHVLVTAGTCEARDTVNVRGRQGPVVDAGADSLIICKGDKAILGGNPAATQGFPPYTYVWSPPQGLNNHLIEHPVATPEIHQDYVLSVTDDSGCVSADLVRVFVVDKPKADAGSDIEVCAGKAATLGGNPSASQGTPPYSYAWSPLVHLNNSTLANPAAFVPSAQSYIMMITDARGCVAWDTVNITPMPGPQVHAGDDIAVCQGKPVIIGGNPTASGTHPPFSYAWSGGETSSHVSTTAMANSAFMVTVTDALGCEGSDTMMLDVLPNPISDFEATQGGGLHVAFTSLSAGATAWEWDLGDGKLSQQEHPNHTYFMPGQYLVCLSTTNRHGCEDLKCDTLLVEGASSVEDLKRRITIFPNPTTDKVSLQGLPSGSTVVVSDARGSVLWQSQVEASAMVLFLGEFAPATYHVRVIHATGVVTFPIVVH